MSRTLDTELSGLGKGEVVEPELLLMRHGAGVKPGQDPAKTPPGPDGVLTAQGYRDAQAVGHVLAETLTSAAAGRKLVVWYAGQLAPPAVVAPVRRRRWRADWPAPVRAASRRQPRG